MKKNNVFEDSVELYEEWFAKNNYILNSEIESIRSMLITPGKGIEIGVGTGIFSSRLGIKYGVEPSEGMREKAIERGIDVIDAFAEELPIADEKYNFALMVTVDCFLKDVMKAFEEVWRILSKDGTFIIAFIDRETPLGMLYDKNKDSDHFYKTANFHSAKEIEKFLEKTGYIVLEKKQTVFSLENKPQKVKDGVGEGVFAVIKAKKQI